jgi:hypothetical protein
MPNVFFVLRRWGLLAAILWTAVAAPSQTIITNFPGLTLNNMIALGTGGTPPDTMGAAGTNQFVEFINGGFAVYNKSGVEQLRMSDVSFWLNAGISSGTMSAGLTDPRIIYDAGSGRWIATELTVDETANKVLVARSDSADPAGTWQAVSFQANSGFGDFDTLGVDSLGVYVGVNNFTSGGSFTGVSFFSIPKADLLAATPSLSNMTRFDNLSASTYGFTLQGVCNPDAGSGHGVICSVDAGSTKYIDRTTVNGPGSAGATLSTRVRITCSYFNTTPNSAHQPSGQTIDAGDERFSAAVRQVGDYIFIANTILRGSLDAVHWMVFKETNNVLIGEGLIYDTTYDYFYPSIAANRNGQILLVFNRSGSTSPGGDISIYAAAGTFTNNTVTMGSPFLLKAGTVSDFALSFDSAPYRWGDYSATMADPTDANLFWTIQEIPVASANWGTQITLISVATNRPALNLALSGSNVILKWPLSADPAYSLQSATNLVNAIWTTVTNLPVISINQKIVTLTVTNGPVFFRLKK